MHMHIDPAGTVRTMNAEEQKAAARARGERLMRWHQAYLADLREAGADAYLDAADDTHEVLYSVSACELLAETSPDDGYLRGYFYGRGQLLRELAVLTERDPESV